ncbi:MAG: hypothetical protein WDN45_11050 [Caulobacteraceae bacterium]
MLAIALAIGAAGLAAGATIRLGRTLPAAAPPAPCMVFEGGRLHPLDYVDSLETCGARLEALYLQDGQPAAGAYGGLRVFADAQGIDAASLHGPRKQLVSPFTREVMDYDIRRLLDARRRKGVIGLDIGPS